MSKTGTAVSFGYDAEGLRVSKTVSGTTTKYFYTGGQLTDLKKGSDTLHFTYDVLGPATVTYNGTVYYYLRNAQGDITGIVNSSGTQVVDYTYEAWGVKMTRTGTMADTLGVLNPFRYRGYVYDEESGLLGDSGIRLRFCKRYYIWHSFLMERMNDGKVFRNEQTV